ncbi:MAG: ribosome maturation factor RimM [Cyanobacteria bacterium J06648_10]
MSYTTPDTATAETTDKDWLLIGRIVGAHGLNGHVKVYPESDFPERFVDPGERWLKKPGKEPIPIKLTSGRYLEGTKNYLVKLAGINYRDQAEDLRSAQLVVPAGDRLPLDPGEFHVDDLVGLKVVVQADGTELGTVTNVFTTGHDLLEVTLNKQEKNSEPDRINEMTQTSLPEENHVAHTSVRAKAAEKLRRKAKRAKKKKKPKTLLIPFVEDIVPIVDIESGWIEITPPPGLIDL